MFMPRLVFVEFGVDGDAEVLLPVLIAVPFSPPPRASWVLKLFSAASTVAALLPRGPVYSTCEPERMSGSPSPL